MEISINTTLLFPLARRCCEFLEAKEQSVNWPLSHCEESPGAAGPGRSSRVQEYKTDPRGLSPLPDMLEESNTLKMQQPDPTGPKGSLELWFECHKKKVSLKSGGGALRDDREFSYIC